MSKHQVPCNECTVVHVAFFTYGDWKVLGLRLSVSPCLYLSAYHEFRTAESLSITKIWRQILPFLVEFSTAQ
jgi:hypothetical protein